MDAIRTMNLKKSFIEDGKEFFAVDGINLNIKKGEIYGFLGPNGAGKTTTIYMLTTLLLPTSGKAEILGFDAMSDAGEIRKRIGLCIGGTRFYFEMNAKELLSFFGMSSGIPKHRRNAKIKELIKDLKIESFQNKPFTELSTGMKQKIALAKALINDPEVLFLDEPTNGLDVEIAHDMRNYIKDIVDDTGVTALLTSHHLYEVEDLCKRISIIDKGKVVSEGPIKDVKRKVNMPDIVRLVLDDYTNLDFIKKIDSVIDFHTNENGIFLKVSGNPESVIKTIEMIKREREVLDIEIRKASLEEVFMKIVGDKDG